MSAGAGRKYIAAVVCEQRCLLRPEVDSEHVSAGSFTFLREAVNI